MVSGGAGVTESANDRTPDASTSHLQGAVVSAGLDPCLAGLAADRSTNTATRWASRPQLQPHSVLLSKRGAVLCCRSAPAPISRVLTDSSMGRPAPLSTLDTSGPWALLSHTSWTSEQSALSWAAAELSFVPENSQNWKNLSHQINGVKQHSAAKGQRVFPRQDTSL